MLPSFDPGVQTLAYVSVENYEKEIKKATKLITSLEIELKEEKIYSEKMSEANMKVELWLFILFLYAILATTVIAYKLFK